MKNKNFYLYLAATRISTFGSLLSFFSIPLIIYAMYNSGIIVSIFEVISTIISIVFSIPFGFWLEGKNLKNFWILSTLTLALCGMFVFLYLNVFTLLFYNITCIFLFIGIGISTQTILVDIVKKEELSWANNVIFSILILEGILAPILGGYILTISWKLPFLLDSITFFIEIIFIVFIPIKIQGTSKNKRKKLKVRFKETIRIINENKILKYVLSFMLITSLIIGGIKIINIAYFSKMTNPYILYGSASTFMAIGMGTIIALNMFKIIKIKKPYNAMVFSLLFYLLFFVSIILFYHSILSVIVFVLLGLGNGIVSPNSNAVIQQYTPRDHLTRVLSLTRVIYNGSKMVSLAILGILVDISTPYNIYLLMGVFILFCFLIFQGTIKKL